MCGPFARSASTGSLILNREHLEHVLAAFVAHYNTLRPDPALDLTPPQRARPLFALTKDSGELHVQRRDRLGGEIHEYGRAA